MESQKRRAMSTASIGRTSQMRHEDIPKEEVTVQGAVRIESADAE